eukprot:scaffold1399_cov410-Prasinococcus_capsulatus_cf.AAC.18
MNIASHVWVPPATLREEHDALSEVVWALTHCANYQHYIATTANATSRSGESATESLDCRDRGRAACQQVRPI